MLLTSVPFLRICSIFVGGQSFGWPSGCLGLGVDRRLPSRKPSTQSGSIPQSKTPSHHFHRSLPILSPTLSLHIATHFALLRPLSPPCCLNSTHPPLPRLHLWALDPSNRLVSLPCCVSSRLSGLNATAGKESRRTRQSQQPSQP